MADAERMTTSTMCHDEPKFYVNLVNFSVEYTSTETYSVNAMCISVET